MLLGLGPAAAEKSDIAIKTRSAEITVDIAKELKRYPEVVADCLAEGRRWVAKARTEAEEEYKTSRDWFKGGRRWTYERIYSFRSLVGGRYLSIIRHDGTFTGGAHPNSQTDTILWDNAEKKRISIRPFFKEMADDGPTMTALAKLARRAVAVEKLRRWKDADPDDERTKTLSAEAFGDSDDGINNGIKPSLLKIGPISLAPSTMRNKSAGLTFHYSPYDVDAYAAGPYTVFVPYTEFKDRLSPEGIAIFGGERPNTDEQQL
jgi:hypothetical protein